MSDSGCYVEAKSPEAFGKNRRGSLLMKGELWMFMQVSIERLKLGLERSNLRYSLDGDLSNVRERRNAGCKAKDQGNTNAATDRQFPSLLGEVA